MLLDDDTATGGPAPPASPAPPDESPAPPAPATIAEGAPAPAGPPPSHDWIPDWREKFAGGDDKFLDKLRTMGSPVDLAKSYRELEKWKDSSRRIPELPDKPTDAQVAEYRKAAGVPLDGKYNFELGDGFVWAEKDKAPLEDFAKFAYDAHMPERYARTAVAWQALYNRQTAAEYAAKDKKFFNDSMVELSTEWGPEFEANKNASGLFFGRLSAEDHYELLNGRTASGKVIGNHPGILRWASQMEKTLNPVATLLPAGGGDSAMTMDHEEAAITKMMRENPDEYYSDAGQRRAKRFYEAKAAMEERGHKHAQT